MSGVPLTIERSNLSLAWGEAFLEVLKHPKDRCRPLIVSIGGFTSPLPPEDADIRKAVDAALATNKKCNSCDVSAMTIFPYKLWIRRTSLGCKEFSDFCVDRLLPRLQALDQRNRRGTYFQRLMAYESVKGGKVEKVNQVEEVVDRLKGRKQFRATGLQMTCFHPVRDHKRQPRLGFPCLQHVSVTYEGRGGFAVTGFYPAQHIFERAYGNYLGLAHLGRFLSDQTGLELRRVNCMAMHPTLGSSTSKSAVAGLKKLVEQKLSSEV
jgi:hypothetical protein